MTFKNNVTRLLDGKRVPYAVYTYDYGAGIQSAVDVAAAVGKSSQAVYKTLVVLTEPPTRKPLLVMLPGPDTLNLKMLAKAVGAKKVKMAAHEQAERLTGLKTGGISPLALMNKGFDVYLDERACKNERIVLSAGERGAQVELAVTDLIELTRARTIVLYGGTDGQ